MSNKIEKDIPFSYERGQCKLNGSTEIDRKALRLEIILHWTWKIILALAILIGVIIKLYV